MQPTRSSSAATAYKISKSTCSERTCVPLTYVTLQVSVASNLLNDVALDKLINNNTWTEPSALEKLDLSTIATDVGDNRVADVSKVRSLLAAFFPSAEILL